MSDERILNEYHERFSYSENHFKEKYKMMHYSTLAKKQIMPPDIGESTTNSDDSNASRYILPWLPIIQKQLKREISANMPQFKIKENAVGGKDVVDEFYKKLAEILSFNNFNYKAQFGYDIGFDKGTIIERTVYRQFREDRINGDPIDLGGGIDFYHYDPQIQLLIQMVILRCMHQLLHLLLSLSAIILQNILS